MRTLPGGPFVAAGFFSSFRMDSFLAYQDFPSPEVAQPLLDLLRQHGVAFETNYEPARFSAVFGKTTTPHFVVRLHAADFEPVRQLEETANVRLLAQLPSDHYLFGFSDEELMELLARPDEWNGLDVALASRLLRERGRDVSPEAVQQLRQRRVAELARPADSSGAWIAAGYGFALLGGLVGLFIGLHLFSHQKILPDGRRVPAFSAADRRHGRRIFALSLASVLLWTGIQVAYGPLQSW